MRRAVAPGCLWTSEAEIALTEALRRSGMPISVRGASRWYDCAVPRHPTLGDMLSTASPLDPPFATRIHFLHSLPVPVSGAGGSADSVRGGQNYRF